jgi:selenocysteine lyase/cysteine desulfurase
VSNWNLDPLSLERNEWGSFDKARQAAADLYGCHIRRVILCENTSNAMSLASQMILGQLPSRRFVRPNVVLHWESHPASSFPWLNAQKRGLAIELRWPKKDDARTPADSLLGAVDKNTVAVVVTDVSYLTGELLFLAPIFEARRKSSWALLVDAAQSAGAMPLDQHVAHADFVGFPAYKWLFGAPGAGFLLVSDEWLDRALSPIVGWAAAKPGATFAADAYDPPDGGAAFRYGMPSFLPLAAAEEGLRLAKTADQRQVADRIRELTSVMLEGLARLKYLTPTPLDPTKRAGVIAVDVVDADGANSELLKRNIVTVPEQGRLRLDLHALNSFDDVERVLDCLEQIPARFRG